MGRITETKTGIFQGRQIFSSSPESIFLPKSSLFHCRGATLGYRIEEVLNLWLSQLVWTPPSTKNYLIRICLPIDLLERKEYAAYAIAIISVYVTEIHLIVNKQIGILILHVTLLSLVNVSLLLRNRIVLYVLTKSVLIASLSANQIWNLIYSWWPWPISGDIYLRFTVGALLFFMKCLEKWRLRCCYWRRR